MTKDPRGSLLYCFSWVVCLLLASRTTGVEAEINFPPPNRGVAAQDERVELPPSMREFKAIFNDVAKIPPEERDYASMLLKIRGLCERYPGSKASSMSLIAVKHWLDGGRVTEAEAKPLLDLRDKDYPGKAEVEKALVMYNDAKKREDTDALREVARALEEIRTELPGTRAGHDALSNLPAVYRRLGQHTHALEAARAYLAEYPPRRTDYRGSESKANAITFTEAGLTARLEGVDAGLKRHKEIAKRYANNTGFVITALYRAGELALEHNRFDEAIDLFSEIVDRFPKNEDQRVTLARFRIGEALLKRRDPAAAMEVFQELLQEHRNTRQGEEAQEYIEYTQHIAAEMAKDVATPVDQPPLAAVDAPKLEAQKEPQRATATPDASLVMSETAGAAVGEARGWSRWAKGLIAAAMLAVAIAAVLVCRNLRRRSGQRSQTGEQ